MLIFSRKAILNCFINSKTQSRLETLRLMANSTLLMISATSQSLVRDVSLHPQCSIGDQTSQLSKMTQMSRRPLNVSHQLMLLRGCALIKSECQLCNSLFSESFLARSQRKTNAPNALWMLQAFRQLFFSTTMSILMPQLCNGSKMFLSDLSRASTRQWVMTTTQSYLMVWITIMNWLTVFKRWYLATVTRASTWCL